MPSLGDPAADSEAIYGATPDGADHGAAYAIDAETFEVRRLAREPEAVPETASVGSGIALDER